MNISPHRGTIYDRNGNVLATSVDAMTIYANPKEIEDVSSAAEAVASALGGDADEYAELLKQDTTFVYLKRKADMDAAEALKSEGIVGIYYIEDTKRVYPYGKVAGQVLGFVNVDDEGVSGLELYYDDILKGTPGKLVVQQGGGGIPIPGGTEVDEPAVDGQDIVVSIDIDMQSYLEKRLAEGVSTIEGEDGQSCAYGRLHRRVARHRLDALFRPFQPFGFGGGVGFAQNCDAGLRAGIDVQDGFHDGHARGGGRHSRYDDICSRGAFCR